MALKGLRVLEFAGLAPAPFCGMVLADFGAQVTRIDRTPKKGKKLAHSMDTLARGKKSIAVDLKHPEGIKVVKRLCSSADILIEPFRRGVMEKIGLGPEDLIATNPGLIYARMTGFGQQGPWSQKAGHDINYIAISGVLSQLGRKNENPFPPINLAADFAGGGLICALGILMALFERSRSGKGQVVDANMVSGSAYVSSFFWTTRNLPIWTGPRGTNLLDGGRAFYGTYRTKDDKFVSVGALEPQFYSDLLKGMGIPEDELPQFSDPDEMERKFTSIFETKTRDEWTQVFDKLDACFAPVLNWDEAADHPHNKEEVNFMQDIDGVIQPTPAPKLSRTPGVTSAAPAPVIGQDTVQFLTDACLSPTQIKQLLDSGVVFQHEHSASKL